MGKELVKMKSFHSKSLYLLLCLAVLLIGLHPFIKSINCIYPGDWNFFLGKYEAVRRSLVDFYQFPYWNPWQTGGTPLFGLLDIGVFSIDTLFAIVFGTVAGLKISILVHILIGAVGMYFFLGDYVKSDFAIFWGVVLFSLQGALGIHLSAGHMNMISIVWLPWVLYLSTRVKKSYRYSLLLGLVLGIVANEGIHYLSIIIFMVVFLALLFQFISNYKNPQFYLNLILCLLLFASLSFYRLAIALQLAIDYPREMAISVNVPFWRYLYGLILPGQSILSFEPMLHVGGSHVRWFWHEFGWYLGVIPICFFLVSLAKGVKWWHLAAVITFFLAWDSSSQFLPGYWLRQLPVFKSMWVITRWRFLTAFFLIMGSVSGLEYLMDRFFRNSKVFKATVSLLVTISVFGLVYNQYFTWNSLEKYKISEQSLLNKVAIHSDTILTSGIKDPFGKRLDYPCVHKGIGLIYSYENILGYSTDYKSRRIPFEAGSSYGGEIYPIGSNDIKVDWTSNKIFITAKSSGQVWINQNPGSYWRLNDEQLFPGYKAFEMNKPFILDLPSHGSYALVAEPPYNSTIIMINILFSLLFIVCLLVFRKRLITHP